MTTIIDKLEVEDEIQNYASGKISDIFYLIKQDCYDNHLPILNNLKNNAAGEFIDLVMDCLDINQIYLEKNKINNN